MAYVQRTADWVVGKAFLHANRKATMPTGTKYNALLAIVDSIQKLWEQEPDTEWGSLYSLETLTPVVSATDTYALPDTVNYLSRRQGEYVLVTDGTNTERYKIISPNQLYEYRDSKAVAKIGRNLKFSSEFDADSTLIGYNIKVPAITFCDDIDLGTDLVEVDDPMWLAYMSAEEFIRQDVVKRNTKNDLLELAGQVMAKMKQNNAGSLETIPMDTGFIQNLDY